MSLKDQTRGSALDGLANALSKRKKSELIEIIMELGNSDRSVMRTLESRFDVEVSAEQLINSTRQAIIDATDFDQRQINYNFSYDYEAYAIVETNFGRLIKLGHLSDVMILALELMSRGSYQIEMSDEGMMTDEVKSCTRVAIAAVRESTIPAGDVITWCDEMCSKDRVGFICYEELQSAKDQFKMSK